MKKILILLLCVSAFSCKKVGFDDPTTLTRDEAFANVKGLPIKITGNSVQVSMFTSTDFGGVHLGMLADQSTTTNRSYGFWGFSDEPRLPIDFAKSTSTTSPYRFVIESLSDNFYQANLDATISIESIDKGQAVTDASGDRTQDVLAAAYFAKGVSQGYLGTIYDRGVIVDKTGIEAFDLPNSYKELILNAVKHLEKAIQVATAATNFKFDFITNRNFTKTEFIQLANSMAARLLASIPRDKAEATALGAAHWDKVLAFANAGLATNLIIPGIGNYNGYYHNNYDWANFLLSDGSAYLPVDIKLAWLVNPSHPKFYPTASGVILPPVVTDDNRFYQYFGYVSAFGFLNESRRRGLFSNYYRKRWDIGGAQDMSASGAPNPYFLAEEVRLLKAEANLFKGNFAGAALLLNDPAARRNSVGGLLTSNPVLPTEASVRHNLHYEYSIEIDEAGGVANPLAFMRRNDLLIGGTATQLPVPQGLLELAKITPYTFGGKGNEGVKGKFGETTTAANVGWKLSQ